MGCGLFEIKQRLEDSMRKTERGRGEGMLVPWQGLLQTDDMLPVYGICIILPWPDEYLQAPMRWPCKALQKNALWSPVKNHLAQEAADA